MASCWNSNTSARRARICRWRSSPIGHCPERRCWILRSSYRSPTPPASLTKHRRLIRASMPDRCASPGGLTRGVSWVMLYTRSKSIDDASSFSGPGGTVVQFIDNLNLERGLSSFDQRNNLQTTFLLSSPVGVHGLLRNGGWADRTLTGWTVSGTFTAASGTPLTALVAGNLSNTAGPGRFRQHARRSHRASHLRRRLPLLQPGGIYHASVGRVWKRRQRHHSGTVSGFVQFRLESRLPVRRHSPPTAVAAQRHQCAQPRGHYQFRHDG